MIRRSSILNACVLLGCVVAPAAAAQSNAPRPPGPTPSRPAMRALASRVGPKPAAVSFTAYTYLDGVAQLWPAVSSDGSLWFPATQYLPGGGIVSTYRALLVRMTPAGVFDPHVLESCNIPPQSIFYVCTPIPSTNVRGDTCIDAGNDTSAPVGRVQGNYSVVQAADNTMWFTYSGLVSQTGSGATDGNCELGRIASAATAPSFFSSPNQFTELTPAPDQSLWLWNQNADGTYSVPLERRLSRLAIGRVLTKHQYATCTLGPPDDVWCAGQTTSGLDAPTTVDDWAELIGPGRPTLRATYPLPAICLGPHYQPSDFNSMVLGSDGNLWFLCPGRTSNGATQLVRVTPQGTTTAFSAGSQWFYGNLTVGPHGNLWFVASVVFGPAGILGYFTYDGKMTVVASTSPSGSQQLLPFAIFPIVGAPNGTLYGMGPIGGQNSATKLVIINST
jgi:hypothetical protein